MKFYRLSMVMTVWLCSSLSLDAFWQKWIDTITTKIYTTTNVITHKEFKHIQELELHNTRGSIIINSWEQDTVACEIITSCPQTVCRDIKVDIEQVGHQVKIHTIFMDEKIKGSVIFNILLPKNTQLKLSAQQGDIIIKNVYNNIQAHTDRGAISILNPHKNIHAKSGCGNIIIRTDHIEKHSQISLESDKGDIELQTTPKLNSFVQADALQGKVNSQIPITLESKTTTLDAAAWKNFQQSVQGTIGNPASTTDIMAHHGSIFIMTCVQ